MMWSLVSTLGGGTRYRQQRFDPYPDLTIIVGRQPWQELLVDSRAVCRASPVLRKRLSDVFILQNLLTPRRGRVRSEDMIREDFPDDDPAAFCTLMDIVHSRYDIVNLIPNPDVEMLFKIVQLATKYEMIRILRPYSATWLTDLTTETRTTLKRIDPANLKFILYVAWTLGEDELFLAVAERLAELCPVDEEGELLENSGGERLKDYAYLQEIDVLDVIKRFRYDRVMAISNACSTMGDKLMGKAPRPDTNFGPAITRNESLVEDYPEPTLEHLGRLVTISTAAGVTPLFLPSASPYSELERRPSPLFRLAVVDLHAHVNQTLAHPDLSEWRKWHHDETERRQADIASPITPIMQRIMEMHCEQSFVKQPGQSVVRGRRRTRR